MKQKLITILLAFGIAKASAEKYLEKVDLPDEADFDPEKLVTDFKTAQAELLKNDKDFIGSIQDNEAKKWNDIWATKIKQATGLTAEEIKDKNQKEIIALAVDKLRKKGDSTTEQLQTENIRLENELKNLTENVLPGKDAEVANFKKNILKESAFEKMFDGFELGVSKKVAMAAVRATMGNNFVDDLNDKNELEIFLAGDGKLKPKKKDGSGLVTASEFIKEILAEEKLLKVSGGSGGDGSKATPIVVSGKDGEKTYSNTIQSNINKATANIDEMKTAIDANSK